MQIKSQDTHLYRIMQKPIEKPVDKSGEQKKRTELPRAHKRDFENAALDKQKPQSTGKQPDEEAFIVSLHEEEPARYATPSNEEPIKKADEPVLPQIQGEKPKQQSYKAQSGQPSNIQDNSMQLARRLVAAVSQFEVQQIIGEASKDLIALRMVAGTADADTAKTARAIIKRLEKMVRRGHKKISDLGKEEGMWLEQDKAERLKKKQRAEEIKKQLREHIRKRKLREKEYLREEKGMNSNETEAAPNIRLDAATEAQIAMQAQMQASMEVDAQFAGSGIETGAGVFGASSGDMGADAAGGGMQSEVAADAGGEG